MQYQEGLQEVQRLHSATQDLLAQVKGVHMVGETAFNEAVELALKGYWIELLGRLELCPELACHRDDLGRSLLHWLAGLDGAAAVIPRLLELNRDALNQSDDSGATPLGNAIHSGHRLGVGTDENVQLLVDGGADLRLLDETGNPPLHAALYERRWSIVKYLLARGADVLQLNAYGDDAYRYTDYLSDGEAKASLPVRD